LSLPLAAALDEFQEEGEHGEEKSAEIKAIAEL